MEVEKREAGWVEGIIEVMGLPREKGKEKEIKKSEGMEEEKRGRNTERAEKQMKRSSVVKLMSGALLRGLANFKRFLGRGRPLDMKN